MSQGGKQGEEDDDFVGMQDDDDFVGVQEDGCSDGEDAASVVEGAVPSFPPASSAAYASSPQSSTRRCGWCSQMGHTQRACAMKKSGAPRGHVNGGAPM